MPLSEDRALTQITIPAKAHMKNIVAAIRRTGIPTNGSMWLSSLILAQPMPNGNGSEVERAPVPDREEEK